MNNGYIIIGGSLMQHNSIAEYRSFLQYYLALLSSHLFKPNDMSFLLFGF